ncbi:PLD nuclease N-terminal domain-containing protein [Quadrisphaera sp. DSM 44207]|uniref:PLD nuclease N-terminal domain-containing protein n=1 Tax=Quadrisphaera sp. DSM 44207 TaxID=1881057 RepID=UPI0008873139|nr:PLD nuclease N-terminal domain-containing protein [Quadrisphaera sp. DSM 44207]SDQ15860.1 Phospholipase_D-nuclease N-terminal [Quadrisphaera sp. DSM 44207]
MRPLLALLALVLVVYALLDCLRRPGDQVRGLPKALWLAVIVLLPVVGAVAWLLAGRGRGRGPGGSRPPQRPVAPDDDPEFLWRLEQERRRQGREDREGQEG